MANTAVMLTRPYDNNPITQLLLRHGQGEIEPPEGYVFLSDENHRILMDEDGAYLTELKEDQT